MRSYQNSEYQERVIQIRRVSKATTGGNNISFTALVVIGNKEGKVGSGYAKAKDVAGAVKKAISKAKKSLIDVKMKDTTIPHDIKNKYGSAVVYLKPAPKGSGLIAGGSIRTVLELAGITDISSKMMGSNNKICNVRCTIEALNNLKG